MKFEEFIANVEKWSEIRGFTDSDPKVQFLSCVEESVKEISEAKMNLDDSMLVDAIGDTAVTLVILEKQLHKKNGKALPGYSNLVDGSYIELMFGIGSIGAMLRRERWYDALEMVYFSRNSLEAFCKEEGFDFNECCKIAWNVIKDRNGMMVNGSYIKEADFTDAQRIAFSLREAHNGL